MTTGDSAQKWHAQDIYDAHALAIGKLVIAWNEFQETLTELFARLFGKERWGEALAAWQALVNDNAQREMLRAVAQQKLGADASTYKEILWIVEEAKKHLADHRNFGIHTPLMILTDLEEGTTSILPNAIYGNVRARSGKVKGKDLVELFGTYEKQIKKMTTFAFAVGFHISDPNKHALPQRPQLQFVPQDQTPKANPKSNKLKARLPRGLMDRAPAEIAATQRMLETIRKVYELYGFEPVETPAIEYTDALGKFLPDQDRPNEGVFSFQDDDEQWLSLRYDLTAPLARYVAEHFDTLPKPYRSYRAGWVFRNEKPGPGRFRQFMQFDADTVGSTSPAADAEICMMAADTMEELGIPRGSYVVKVNNRKVLDGVLIAIGLDGAENASRRLTVLRAIDKLDRLEPNEVMLLLGPGRKDDSGDFTRGAGLSEVEAKFVLATVGYGQHGKISSTAELPDLDELDDAFVNLNIKFSETVSGREGAHELRQIKKLIDEAGYATRIVIDRSVVRGLEYYTGAVYELELTFPMSGDNTKASTGAQPVRFGSVGGGGRYDGLVARFRGEPVPATGISIGVSRLLVALTHLGKINTNPEPGPVIVTVFDQDRLADYQRMASELRAAGIRAELYLGAGRFGPQMKYADRRHSPCVVIQGSDEKQKGEVQIKDLILGAELAGLSKERDDHLAKQAVAQFAVPESRLVEAVREVLARHGIA